MEFTQAQISQIIGEQYLEIVGLRLQCVELQKRIEELTPKSDNVLPIKDSA